MKRTLFHLMILTSFVFLSCASSEDANNPPEIKRLEAIPSVVTTQDYCTLVVNAEDEDGDSLKFIWDVSQGSISNPGQSAIWLLKDVAPGVLRATCIVSDGKAVVSRDVTITKTGQ